MARTSEPHSATAQFFINVADNDFPRPQGAEPAGLGLLRVREVVAGQDVVDKIKGVPTGNSGFHQNVPTNDVVITRAEEVADRMRPTLFLSDLHLSPARPALVAAFDAFCTGPAREAAGVYLLGDLFDAWIGDDQLREPLPAGRDGCAASVTDSGVPVGMSPAIAIFCLASASLAPPGPCCCRLRSWSMSREHPRCCCTATRCARRTSAINACAATRTTRDWQRRYLALPYGLRRGIADWLRRQQPVSGLAAKPETSWMSRTLPSTPPSAPPTSRG